MSVNMGDDLRGKKMMAFGIADFGFAAYTVSGFTG